ncbi:uncharacterized protein LOC107636557 [Arachis ipaensis]|uniref:uncharacterized protein LOC107636557 n=1 Tax=Arachis ipaensis TaxID=130454 RepID=UPI0007AF5559|nr:uncharacterized protein LOC107636557 [Arachis ipaensis]XP_025647699.1 uncharacterized protein LOC112742678 [Arachis hypogaea]
MRVSFRNFDPWVLSAVYGSPNRIIRRSLWSSIISLAENNTHPWCLLGDFNSILHNHERRGGSTRVLAGACSEFQHCVSSCGLIDLGYDGWPFTRKRGNLVERLDRGLSNLDWQIRFPEARIIHLPPLKSDHNPICLQLETTSFPNRGRRPFRFQAAWLTYPDFKNVVNSSWSIESSWNNGISSFRDSLKKWNTNVFGNILKKKRKIIRRLQGITNTLDQGNNNFLEELRGQLWKEY